MIRKLKYVLAWTKYNKIMTIVFLMGVSLIVASNLLLAQFFYEQSTDDNGGRHYYDYYFDEGIPVAEAVSALNELENKITVSEYLVASGENHENINNDYYVAAYLKTNSMDEQQRNEAMAYGSWQEETGKYVKDNTYLDGSGGLEQFDCSGESSIQIGSTYADYRVTKDDFLSLEDTVDAIEVTITTKNRQVVDSVIDKIGISYESEYTDVFLESGFDSVKYSIVICVILLFISLYSMIAFVELFLHMQRQDVVVFYRCGATMRDIRKMYFFEVGLAGILSFAVGVILAEAICKLANLDFNRISFIVFGIVFGIFLCIYILETYVYIRQTLKFLGSKESSIE